MITSSEIRISSEAKQRLVNLKRRSGIKHWNILCRWALYLSLAETSKPPDIDIITDSNVQMSWRTFTGQGNEELILALMKVRCARDGLPTDDDAVAHQFRLHLHRGIGYLSTPGKIKHLSDLLTLAIADIEPQ